MRWVFVHDGVFNFYSSQVKIYDGIVIYMYIEKSYILYN